MKHSDTSLHDDFEELHVRPKPGRTLIVGSRVYAGREDRRKAFPDAVGVDMVAGDGVDFVLNLEDDLLGADIEFLSGPDAQVNHPFRLFDHIECISVLEHSRRPWLLAANLERLLVPGGTIHISVPFVWGLHGQHGNPNDYGGDYFRFSADGIRELFQHIEWTALMYAHEFLAENGKTPRLKVDGHVYIARTEVLGAGVKQ